MRYANFKTRARRGLTLCSALTLAACSTLRDYQSPVFPFLPSFQAAQSATPVLVSNEAWWKRLNDPVLDALIVRSLSGNLSLTEAQARIDQAVAERGTVGGPFQASGAIDRTGTDRTNAAPFRDGAAEYEVSWIFDLFGARATAERAAEGRIDLAEAQLSAARLAVIASVSRAYMDLRFNQRLLHLRQHELTTRRRTLALTRELSEANEATRLETTRARARVAEIEAELPGLRADVQAVQAQLAVLAGVSPGRLGVDLSERGIPMPHLAPNVGIPTDLLRNRPDIQIAEREYYVAVAQIGQAEAAQYPTLSLGGAISLAFAGSGAGVGTGVFGPELDFPDLVGTTGRATVQARRAAARQALSAWQSSVLDAILEVETALLTYDAATSSATAAARATRLYGDALTLTREVFEAGEATLTDLTAAQEAVSRAEVSQAQIAYSRALAFVDLNVRIGAGHGVTPAQLAVGQ